MKQQINDKYDKGDHIRFCLPSQIERDFNTLIGMLKGINADGIIRTEEVTSIAEWIVAVKDYQHKEPYQELVLKITNALEDYHFEEDEIADLIWYCEECIAQIHYFDADTSAIQQLYGILDGIVADGEVNQMELTYLKDWLLNYENLAGKYPFDEICKLISGFLVDDEIDDFECQMLKNFCKAFRIEKANSINDNKDLVNHLVVNVFEFTGNVDFNGKKVCITGESLLYKRKDIALKIAELGAIPVDSVNSKTDCLIVCDKRSHAWSYSMYGRKLEQAISLKEKGVNIYIMHIDDVYPLIEQIA